MTPGVGPRAATRLLERFGSAAGVFNARRPELESMRLKGETIESIVRHEFEEKAARAARWRDRSKESTRS